MGHADITTTMNIYAEATKEKKQQAMANLNGKMQDVESIANSNVELCRKDWDSFETSWDFKHHPLV